MCHGETSVNEPSQPSRACLAYLMMERTTETCEAARKGRSTWYTDIEEAERVHGDFILSRMGAIAKEGTGTCTRMHDLRSLVNTCSGGR